jgi:hypothetical protein
VVDILKTWYKGLVGDLNAKILENSLHIERST